MQLRNLYKFLSLRLLLPFFFSCIELNFVYAVKKKRKKTAQKQKFVSLNGAIAQYWAIQRWSHTKLRRVSPVPSRVPPMCPLSARSPPRSIAPSGGPKHAVWAEIRPAACRRRRRNWPLCGLSGRRGGLHSQITGGEEWEKISKKSTLTYRRNSKRVIWFN